MKRLLLGALLLLAATAGLAQSRDVLLTPDGTLYTVDVMHSMSHLVSAGCNGKYTIRDSHSVASGAFQFGCSSAGGTTHMCDARTVAS